jgi:hypothetical protein
MAKYAVGIENGVKTKKEGMIAAGYSKSYAESSSAASVTVEQALAAKAALLPNEPTNKVINDLSKRKLAERLQDDPSDQLLVTAYKTSGDALANTGEEEADPDEARRTAEFRQEWALRTLRQAQHFAKLGARFGAERVTAALQRRLDEIPPNKMLLFDLETNPRMDTSTSGIVSEILGASYRDTRRRGFALPPAAPQRPWQFQAKR